ASHSKTRSRNQIADGNRHLERALMGPTKTRLLRVAVIAILASSSGGASGCATAGGPGPGGASSETVADPAPRPGVPLVLIAMPPSANDFQDVRRSLLAEIQRDFNVATVIVTSSTAVEELGAAIQRLSPACIVLMNNTTV